MIAASFSSQVLGRERSSGSASPPALPRLQEIQHRTSLIPSASEEAVWCGLPDRLLALCSSCRGGTEDAPGAGCPVLWLCGIRLLYTDQTNERWLCGHTRGVEPRTTIGAVRFLWHLDLAFLLFASQLEMGHCAAAGRYTHTLCSTEPWLQRTVGRDNQWRSAERSPHLNRARPIEVRRKKSAESRIRARGQIDIGTLKLKGSNDGLRVE